MSLLHLSGQYDDVLHDPATGETRLPTRANLVVTQSLVLMGDLLAGKAGIRGLLYWAVGSGDPAWDAAGPPAPDAGTTKLAHEIYRRRLVPADLSYDSVAHVLTIQVVFQGDEASDSSLREFGIFGGDASGWPESGLLVGYGRHPVIKKAAGQTLARTWQLTLRADSTNANLLDAVGALLSNQLDATGISTIAFGVGDPTWDQTPPAFDPNRKTLQKEILRKPIAPITDMELRNYQLAVLVRAALEYQEAPAVLREMGLFGGSRTTPVLLAHQVFPATDHRVAARIPFEYHLELGVDPNIVVPDVTTRTLADATTALTGAGLRAGFVKEQDQVGAKGTVLHQKPLAGEKAVAGAAVDLILALSPKVQAPRLVGLTVADATTLATAAGMAVAPDMPNLESPETAGTVLIQDPAAGELVRPGIAISIVVATPETTLVPDLTGKRPGEAAVLLKNTRLVLADPPYPTQEASGAWGDIILQDLAAGSRKVVNSKVTPTLAAPPLVAIPDLTGKTVDQAPKVLSDAAAGALNRVGLPQQPPGLVIGRVTLAENAASPGTILSQSPAAGPNQNLSIYSAVDISVATPVTVAVPSVVGSTEAVAITAIQNAGLLAASQHRQDPVVAGTVLSQDPPANSRKALGTGVTIVVATTVQVRVPALAKHSVEFATETLVSASLKVGTVTRKPTPGVPPGSILDQSVAAGAMVDIGTAINLTIAGDTAQVPQLQGQSQAAAQKLLSDAGLVLVMGSPVESATVTPGLIAGQSPAAGTTAPVGSTVTANPAIPPKIAVPNLIGKTMQQAQQLATNFVISVSGQAESDQPPGTIAVQNPAPPATASPQSVITVQTAVPRSVAVPAFVGQTLTAAQAQAAAVKLTLSVSSRALSDKPADIVLTQNPAAGVHIAPNSAVVITVSSGVAVRVPSVTGIQSAVAIKRLQAAGLGDEVTDSVPSVSPVGIVVSQSPGSGALVASGTIVELTTSEGKGPNKFLVETVNPALTRFTP